MRDNNFGETLHTQNTGMGFALMEKLCGMGVAQQGTTMICKPCRITYEGQRYQIERDGTVRPTRLITEPVTDGQAMPTGDTFKTRIYDAPVNATVAKAVRADAARQRKNRNARERRP